MSVVFPSSKCMNVLSEYPGPSSRLAQENGGRERIRTCFVYRFTYLLTYLIWKTVDVSTFSMKKEGNEGNLQQKGHRINAQRCRLQDDQPCRVESGTQQRLGRLKEADAMTKTDIKVLLKHQVLMTLKIYFVIVSLWEIGMTFLIWGALKSKGTY